MVDWHWYATIVTGRIIIFFFLMFVIFMEITSWAPMTEKFRDGEEIKLHYDFHESTGASRLFLVPSRSRAQRHNTAYFRPEPYLRCCPLACLAAHVQLFLFHSSEDVTDVHKVVTPKLIVLASAVFINSVIVSTCERRHSFIHTLNDDVLLDIFYLCGPGSSIQDEEDNADLVARARPTCSLVVQTCPCLPTVAVSHTCVTITFASSSFLPTWHTCGEHVNPFTTPSPRHRIPP